MKFQCNLEKHMSIKKQIFHLLRIIKLLIHKLFIHLDYLILIQQILLSLIGVKAKMINKKCLEFIKIFLFVTSIFLVLYNLVFCSNTDYCKTSFCINKISL